MSTLSAACGLNVIVNRDSDENTILKAYQRIMMKAHPDEGGSTKDAQRLQPAQDVWDKPKKDVRGAGRPPTKANAQEHGGYVDSNKSGRDLAQPAQAPPVSRKQHRINSTSVMLTYSGIRNLSHWSSFLTSVRSNLQRWEVNHWCAILEPAKTGNLHIHASSLEAFVELSVRSMHEFGCFIR